MRNTGYQSVSGTPKAAVILGATGNLDLVAPNVCHARGKLRLYFWVPFLSSTRQPFLRRLGLNKGENNE